jgi:hypothetical protein
MEKIEPLRTREINEEKVTSRIPVENRASYLLKSLTWSSKYASRISHYFVGKKDRYALLCFGFPLHLKIISVFCMYAFKIFSSLCAESQHQKVSFPEMFFTLITLSFSNYWIF